MNSDHEITITSGKRSLTARGWGVLAITLIAIVVLVIFSGVAPR